LAVTAYEALTGKVPWRTGSVVEVITSLLFDEAAPPSSFASLPSSLDAVFARALSKRAADRYPSMEAFAAAFEQAASELSAEPDERSSGRAARATPAASARTPSHASDPQVARASGPAITAAVTNPSVAASATSSPAGSTHGGHTSSQGEAPARKPALSRVGLTAGALVLSALAAGSWYLRAHGPAGSERTSTGASAAAAATDPSVACPLFEVRGINEPWLGVAAAVLACERVQLAHGGLDSRTVHPAEIANVPREIEDMDRTAIYESSGARNQSVEAARKRGGRWIDGHLDRTSAAYNVGATLRDASGKALASGDGHAPELFEAVRDALAPILAALGPPSEEETKVMREWLDVGSADEAQDLFDVRTSILVEDTVSLKAACAAAEKRGSLSPRVAYLVKSMCVRKLRTGTVGDPPPALDESTPGALITTALALGTQGGPASVRERAAKLEAAREATPSMEGKARLSAAAAELYNMIGDDRARVLARMSWQQSPKAYDWRTSAWHRWAFASEGDASLHATLLVWQPWEPISQTSGGMHGVRLDASAPTTWSHRAYLLCPRGYYANYYGEELLQIGKIEQARNVAELSSDPYLGVLVLMGEAKYAGAVAAARKILAELPDSDAGAASAFRVADAGAIAALTLGRPADFVEGVVDRYVMSEPPHVVDGVVPFISLVTACSFAPKDVGRRCLDRLRRLRTDGRLPTIFKGADTSWKAPRTSSPSNTGTRSRRGARSCARRGGCRLRYERRWPSRSIARGPRIWPRRSTRRS
jgi:hypothetical protein